MTYEELKQTATALPWKSDEYGVIDVVKGKLTLGAMTMQSYEVECPVDAANAALTVHCVNNFDRALEALKMLENMHYCPACGEVATHKSGCWLPRRIAELETVEDS